MADLGMPQRNGKLKVHSLRIDLTPMVDLGFLLITFFMYTTTLANPKAMEIRMPPDISADNAMRYPAGSTLTLIPTKNHLVIYYPGLPADTTKFRVANRNILLAQLLRKKSEVQGLPTSFSTAAHKLHVLIKPLNDCKYEDVVELLDYMTITDVQTFALADITADEETLIKINFGNSYGIK